MHWKRPVHCGGPEAQGEYLRHVAGRLGQALPSGTVAAGYFSFNITMNIYAHAKKETKHSSARSLDKVVGKYFPCRNLAREKQGEIQGAALRSPENSSISGDKVEKYYEM